MNTLLLPCRHVMFFCKSQNWESSIPPPKYYTFRWSLLSPTNDISAGSVDVARTLHVSKKHIDKAKVLSRDEQYSDANAVCQHIKGIMSDQSADDFHSTYSLLKTVETLSAGEVRNL